MCLRARPYRARADVRSGGASANEGCSLTVPKLHSTRSQPFGTPPFASETSRLHVLDGIRGWAALIVVSFHMVWETFGVRFPIFRNPVTARMLDGNLAVSIFFVLSGEALSAGFLAGKGRRFVVSLGLRRYPRLVIPILGSCAVVYGLQTLGLCSNGAAGQIVDRPDWLGNWIQRPLALSDVVSFAMYDVFTSFSPDRAANPFLWTMRTELIGSIVIFILLLSLHGCRHAWFLVGALYVFLNVLRHGGGQLACFLVGLGLAQLRVSGFFSRAHASRGTDGSMLAATLLLLAVDAYLQSAETLGIRTPVIAGLLMFTVFASRTLSRFMETAPSQFRGRISFPLFLIQFPVIVSLTSFLIVKSDEIHVLNAGTAALIGLASIAASILAACAFEPVEGVAKRASGRMAHAVLALCARRKPTREAG